jgi:type IV secretory pathway protease TraF
MRTFTKIEVRTALILILACLIFVVVVRAAFIVSPMPTDSMQPLISTNSTIVAARWFRTASLHSGDFVIADIPLPDSKRVLTVRQIEQQPDTPAGQFYLRAANTNGWDSRQFGTLPASNIVGRVLWVLK